MSFLAAVAYVIAAILLCRVLGASVAAKRFGIRDLLLLVCRRLRLREPMSPIGGNALERARAARTQHLVVRS
jgi:hypothetical protein